MANMVKDKDGVVKYWVRAQRLLATTQNMSTT